MRKLIIGAVFLSFLVSCSWAIKAERSYHTYKVYETAVDMYNQAETILETQDIAVAHAYAETLQKAADEAKFRAMMISSDIGQPKDKEKEVERSSPEDQTHQVVYLGMIVERKKNKEMMAAVPGKVAAAIASGAVTIGAEITKRLPWYMRYSIYFIVGGALITGVLMVSAWLYIRAKKGFRILSEAIEEQKDKLDTKKLREHTEGTVAQKGYHKLRDKGKLWRYSTNGNNATTDA